MGLTISQTYAQIGIDRTQGMLEIRTQNARLELHSKQPRINIKTEKPRLEIDQYEAFASSGLKGIFDFAKEGAQRGYQQVMEFIGKTAEDGKVLAAIERGGNPIADIAKRDAYPEHEFGYDYMPKAGPKFTPIAGKLEIEVDAGSGALNGVEGDFISGDVSFNFTPSKINIYMKQYASIRFQYTDSRIDKQI
jgi:hypothetical protein